MKIRITRQDGTVIEAEGTPEECARLAALPVVRVTFAPTPWPTYVPTPWSNPASPVPPYPEITWGVSSYSAEGLGACTRTIAPLPPCEPGNAEAATWRGATYRGHTGATSETHTETEKS